MDKRQNDLTILMLFLSYAALVFGGGVMGFALKQSLPSLISGIVFGSLLSFFSLLYWKKKATGFLGLNILAIVLLLFFSFRFITSFQFFPSGFMTLLTLFILIAANLKNKTAACCEGQNLSPPK